MTAKRPRRSPPKRANSATLKLLIPALVKPIVEPAVDRLDKHEQLLLELKSALDIQFRRIAAIQAQLDQLLASRLGSS